MCSVICKFEVNQEFLTDRGRGGAVPWLVVEEKIKMYCVLQY